MQSSLHLKSVQPDDNSSLAEMEKSKVPWGQVTLVGLGRLGFRTALILMQAHRGGPLRLVAIDGQEVSADDLIFRMAGANVGEYKVSFLQRLAGPGFSKEIIGAPAHVNETNMKRLISGDLVCIEIAGGDTLPITAAIIKYAHEIGASTISTMGVFGLCDVPVSTVSIEDADPDNPIVDYLLKEGIRDHTLVGTGKLIRDWEPVIPQVLDRVSQIIASEILLQLHEKQTRNR